MRLFRSRDVGTDRSAEIAALQNRVEELEQRLDHERLYPREWANRRVRDRLGNEVTAGPFAGMQFPDWGLTHIDSYSARVVGSYEQELHGAVEEAIAAAPPVVLNVGAAEGYYAVGLARRLPEARSFACELVADRVQRLAAIATLNGVEIEADCEPAGHAWLAERLVERALVICDIDGPEYELLDPDAVPQLRRAWMIVETHDYRDPRITPALIDRFRSTHDIERIDAQSRWPRDYPELGDLPDATKMLALNELRYAPMWWLVLRPRPTDASERPMAVSVATEPPGGATASGAAAATSTMLHERFDAIYANRIWTDGIDGMPSSGRGSLPEYSRSVLDYLTEQVAGGKIASIADIGCGDLTFMSTFEPVVSGAVSYHGYDVAPSLIASHQGRAWGKFDVADVSAPGFRVDADLVLVKDVLFHLENELVLQALENLRRSSWRQLLITSEPRESNDDRVFDRWHYAPIDVTKPPFSMRPDVELPREAGGSIGIYLRD